MAPTAHHLLDQAGEMWVSTTASLVQSKERSLNSWSRWVCTAVSENKVRRWAEVRLSFLPPPHTHSTGSWGQGCVIQALGLLQPLTQLAFLQLLPALYEPGKYSYPSEKVPGSPGNWEKTKRIYLQSWSYCHQKELNISKFTGWFTRCSEKKGYLKSFMFSLSYSKQMPKAEQIKENLAWIFN